MVTQNERMRCADLVRNWEIKSVGQPFPLLDAIANEIERGTEDG
jgi:hypothetical protein